MQDGKTKKRLARDLFDFDIKLGDKVDYIQDGVHCPCLAKSR